jgi:electron-transferring-flavoprotein dehydrogenase
VATRVASGRRVLIPARHRPDLPVERFVLEEAPGAEAVPLDVCIVGAGPAGLATAIELARLVRAERARGGSPGELEIGLLEKAGGLGEHCLSGAIVNPAPFRELFPDVPPEEMPFKGPAPEDRVYVLTRRRAWRVPTPPTMRNRGNVVASICEIVRWMGARAEALGVHLFTGFPAAALLVQGGRVVGVRTAPAGLGRDGTPGSAYMPPAEIAARVTVLAEGTRGALTQAYLRWQGIGSPNPQIYALGVKELWETRAGLDGIVHTVGWPLPRAVFGGSFAYPMGGRLVAIGLVVGLDYPRHNLDVHVLLQRLKTHPLFARLLDGGECLEWGAKTIPEGGYYSLPDRLSGDGLCIVGDAAGFVDVPSLKGIHYAVRSGILAARAIFAALKAGGATAAALHAYDTAVRASEIVRDLRRTRNMRLAFTRGLVPGTLTAGLLTLTRGAFPGRRIAVPDDAEVPRVVAPEEPFAFDGRRTFGKLDAVFRSGNATRDDIPRHLLVGPDVPPEVAEFYAHMCPAGVYERQGDRLVVNAPNCIDCKATDVLGPRWTPREGGSGPKYTRM